jgi:hypothetical protein
MPASSLKLGVVDVVVVEVVVVVVVEGGVDEQMPPKQLPHPASQSDV